MSSAAEKAVEALELLPEKMREPAAEYLLSAGRVVPWDLADFLRRARQA
jgi:hypothetical protein